MKKLLLMAILAGFTYFGAAAQGNSTYGHSHKKAKKAKKHYTVTNNTSANRKAINTGHRTAIRTATTNDVLTSQQQKDQIKQANATHKQEMRAVNPGKGKKK